MLSYSRLCFFAFSLVFVTQGAIAQHDESASEADHGHDAGAHTVEEHHEGESGHGGGHHELHDNSFGVFMGVTSEDRGNGSFTLGLEYARWLNDSWGVGGLIEHAFGDSDEEFTIGIAFVGWRSGPWKIYGGPGFEKKSHHDTEVIGRIGVEYAFLIDGYEVAPQFNIDIVDGDDVLVVGVVIGKGW